MPWLYLASDGNLYDHKETREEYMARNGSYPEEIPETKWKDLDSKGKVKVVLKYVFFGAVFIIVLGTSLG